MSERTDLGRPMDSTPETMLKRSEELREQALEILKTDPVRSIALSVEAIELAQQAGNQIYRNSALSVHALGLLHVGRVFEALQEQLEITAFNRAQQRPKQLAIALGNVSTCYRLLGEYDKSLDALLESMRICENLNDASGAARAAIALGNLYTDLKEYDDALDCFQRALKYHIEQHEDELASACLNNICSVYKSMEDLPNALHYAQQAYEMTQKVKRPLGIAISLHNLASLHQRMGDYVTAIAELEQAGEITHKLGETSGDMMIYATMAETYLNADDLDNAWRYLVLSRKLAEEQKSKTVLLEILNFTYQYYRKRNCIPEALEAYIQYAELKDELLNKEKTTTIAKMKTQFDAERKEREAEIQRLRNIELAKALEDLKAAQENVMQLERKTSAIATAVTASHEINQPLQIITGALDMLEIDLAAPSAEQKKYLEQAHNSVHRINLILRKLLSIEDVKYESYSKHEKMLAINPDKENECPSND